jgi:ubiquinone/menaquinone biosynthesis C-methylase UbiE
LRSRASLNEFFKAGLKPTECDISVWATEKAKKTFPALEIVRADALCLPFTSETFAVTTAFETLEHCRNLDTVASQIKRVTKPNGLVLVSVPTIDLNDTYADGSHI